MDFGHHRLLAQLGAGPDGVAYRAQEADGRLVEVRVLTGAPRDPDRWRQLTRRLRQAALLDHPVALRVYELALEDDPPFLALAWLEPPDVPLPAVPVPLSHAVGLVHPLSAALAAAHRLGLVHGGLCPGRLRLTAEREPRLDFTGVDARSSTDPSPTRDIDAACRAPELGGDGVPASPADVYGLAGVLCWLLTGHGPPVSPPETPAPLRNLLLAMLAADPAERPTAREVERGLAELLAAGQTLGASPAVPAPAEVNGSAPTRSAPPVDGVLARGHLGRFRLLERLGQGGMGTVYRAEDEADGTVVAIKVLRSDRVTSLAALKRFHKEARLLAEVNNPHVTNLLEVNEDDGLHYLVLEFVSGTNLGDELARRGRFDEPTALAVIADVARALEEAHERGIVHRDIKPDNILLGVTSPGVAPPGPESSLTLAVKLSDFGLARHVVESESLNMTEAGGILGTPFYMAPEQAGGGAIDPRADVYALGATLFHLLAGRPPFVGDTPFAVLAMHRHDPPPSVQKLNSDVSDGAARLVEKMLAKEPAARPANAGAVLREVLRLLRGEASAAVHPVLPPCDPGRVLRYEWTWELESPPRELWPYVSNTDRLNRAIGLPAVHFTTRTDPEEGVRRLGAVRRLGMTAAYQEHPFEWIEGRRMGVLREFTQGPLKWLLSVTELAPRAGGGTVLTQRVQLEPHGLLGRTAAAVEIGLKSRRALDRVYRRIDAALTGKLGRRDLVDPFEEPPRLSGARRRRLEQILDELSERGVDPAVVERLGDFLAQAPAQEVARIRPLALARRLGTDPAETVAACLHGARAGLLLLLWDILCPVCRVPSEVKETLKALREHGHCEACNLDFELNFAGSVEMIFRAHPEIRETELGTYCIAGPAHSPHVVAQLRLAPGERVELELALAEGAYRLRGPQLPHHFDFRVEPSATARVWEVRLPGAGRQDRPPALKSGAQVLGVTNAADGELVVRVERAAPRDDALTAARAASLALFRELFPGEVLSPGQLVSVSTMTFLVTALEGAGDLYERLGDARAFALVHEHFRLLDERVRREGGALVKTVGEGVLAAFSESAAAVAAGLDLQGVLAANEVTRDLRVGVAVHRGPAMAATLNDRLDYFGATVNQATALVRAAVGGEVLLAEAVGADPQSAALLRARGLEGRLDRVDLPGKPGALVHRVTVGAGRRSV